MISKILSIITLLLVFSYLAWVAWVEKSWLAPLILYVVTAIPFLYGLFMVLPMDLRIFVLAFFNSLTSYGSSIQNPDSANLLKLPSSDKSKLVGVALMLLTVICWSFFISQGLKFP